VLQNRPSESKSLSPRPEDTTAKKDLEEMSKKIQNIACWTLVSRLEYILETLEMRRAVFRIREFSEFECKIEAVEYMVQISQRRQMFDSLMQWVKVVYAQELRHYNNSQSNFS
jgi:hypothetical protein